MQFANWKLTLLAIIFFSKKVREVSRGNGNVPLQIEGQRSQPARRQEPHSLPTLERWQRPQRKLAGGTLRDCDQGRGRRRSGVGRARGRTGQLHYECSHHCCSISSYPNFEFPAVFRLAFGEMTYSSSPRPTRARVTRSASSCSPAFGTAATSICREGSRQHNIAPDCGPKLNLISHI